MYEGRRAFQVEGITDAETCRGQGGRMQDLESLLVGTEAGGWKREADLHSSGGSTRDLDHRLMVR